MEEKKLTEAAPPMVLFHGDEYTPFGLDTEFAIPIKEYATGNYDEAVELTKRYIAKVIAAPGLSPESRCDWFYKRSV